MKQPQSFALATCLILIFLGGPWLVLKASEASLPGDLLYSVKKLGEGVQTTVASESGLAPLQVEFASRRLEELDKITDDSFKPEEKNEKAKQVVNELRDNLAGASVNLNKVSEEKVVMIAEKTKRIKERLDQTKEGAPEEVQQELAEAEKAVEELNQVLTALISKIDQDREQIKSEQPANDQEVLIFLEELEDGTITTTDKVINGGENE